MAKFPEWVEQWKEQYQEEKGCEVLKADIKIIFKAPNGEIIIRNSEYESKAMPEIKIVPSPRTYAVNGG